MNASQIFKAAHALTKQAIRQGDSYQVTFAAALRIVHQESKTMKVEIIGRNGALTKIRIVNGAAHADSKPEIGRFFSVDGHDLIVSCAAREIETLRQWIATFAQTAQTKTSERYISLLSEAAGKNHGRAWVADGYAIDKYSLNPEWEGRMICYVYN